MVYDRVNWEDSPSTSTPLNATNLNKMDKGISDCATDIEDMQDTVTQLTTFLTQTLTAGQTTLVFEDASITTNSTFDWYSDKVDMAVKSATTENGKLTMTFDAQTVDVVVKVRWF